MVEMSDSSLLVERKPTYSEALRSTKPLDKAVKDSRQYLNGDISYFGRKERSNSECSSDSQLDNLLEAADRIRNGKNSIKKGEKRVHFNMDKNEEFSYSYTQPNSLSSDDEGSRYSLLSNNINLVGYDVMNGNDSEDIYDDEEEGEEEGDDDDDDDDDDEGEEEEEEEDDYEYDTETSEDGSNHSLGKFGFLVDKSLEQNKEANNNGTNGLTVNGTEESKERNLAYNHQEIVSSQSYGDKKLNDQEAQLGQLEQSLKNRRDSVQRHLSDLSENLRKTREETRHEMEQLKTDLKERRLQYSTEINEIGRRREEQTLKFEEELEEFQNEKKLEERRQRYQEHEALITEKEADLEHRKQQAAEQEREIRECEEYLNRRHAVCNSKEEDLSELQKELETLSQELEAKKERLLNKTRGLERQMQRSEQEDTLPPLTPLPDRRSRSASRVSTMSRGVDLRIEELKYQNRQLLEELFTLKKAVESKDEELGDTKKTMAVLGSENKRLLQKVKNLDSQLELARKSAELDTVTPSVDEILRKTATDIRNSRVLRPSRIGAVCSSSGSHVPLPRALSKESLNSKGSKGSGSSDSGKGTKESVTKSSRDSLKGAKDSNSNHRETTKSGGEKVTSALCIVM